MPFEIRVLRAGDEDALKNVHRDVFDHPIRRDTTLEFLSDPRHHLVVAVDDGVVIGMASAVHYVHPDKPAELWINEVSVAPTRQNQGIAKAILNRLLAVAREIGCREAWVLTDRDNTPAMRLYASTGGKEDPGDQVMFTYHL